MKVVLSLKKKKNLKFYCFVTKCNPWETLPTKICDIGPFTGVYTKGKLMARELEAVVAFLVQGLIQSRIYHVVEAGLNS